MKVTHILAYCESPTNWQKEWYFQIIFTRSASVCSSRSYKTKKAAIEAGKRFCKSAGWEFPK